MASIPTIESSPAGVAAGIYQKLPENTIRLLVLHSGSVGDPLKGNIEFTDTDPSSELDLTPYEALSYVWGDATFPESIICGGCTIPITRNLSQALNQLRHHDSPRVLWVDAICINQKDKLEKASQIPLMPSIYSRARNVIVWLGPADESTKLALKLCRKAAACARNEVTANQLAAREAGVEDTRMIRLTAETFTEQKLQHWGLPSKARPEAHYEAFGDLCDREWFSRVWTHQEVMLATSANINIGEECLDWLEFALAVEFFVQKHMVFWNLAPEIAAVCLTSKIWAVGYTGSDYTNHRHNLETVLAVTRNLLTSEPRDKIYGILGLTRRDLHCQIILIDYEIPLQALYKRVTLYLITRSHDVGFPLNVLSHAGFPDVGAEDFPSWVTQWHKPPLSTRIVRTLSHTSGGSFNYPETKVNLDASPGSLWLQGFTVGVIEHEKTYKTNEAKDDGDLFHASKFLDICRVLYSFGDFAINGDIAGQPLAQVCASTLSFGEYRDAVYFQFICWSLHETMLDASNDSKLAYKHDCLGREWCSRVASMGNDIQNLTPDLYLFFVVMKNCVFRRALFRTGGNHLGMGPTSLEAGDQLCILFGGRVPYILRPLHDGTFRFIGECYVHGIMHGEALEQGRKRQREFVLV